MRFFLLLFTLVSLAENVETGITYKVKTLKGFAPKGEDKNSIAHFILFKEPTKKHVVEVFCLIPYGEEPKGTKRVKIGERNKDAGIQGDFFCDLEK